MKILPTVNNTTVSSVKTRNKTKKQYPQCDLVSFKRIDFDAARAIQNRIASSRGISMNVNGNAFVAECYEKVIEVFEKLFKKSYLPSFVGTAKFTSDSCFGQYSESYNSVNVNENLDYTVFEDMDTLKECAKKHHNNIILPNWASSNHPAHTFVHEFSHAAHWHHLEERNGYQNAQRVWYGLEGTRIPNAIGRLIAKFKISEYAVGTRDKCDMCEFLAERMAKDICGGLTDNLWVPYKDIDVNYSDIFNRKWDYRYSSPQSYIDYFTQQVWNGDIEEAKRTGDRVEQYLAELEAERVAPIVQRVAATTEKVPLLNRIGDFLVTVSENITDALDRKNKITIRR